MGRIDEAREAQERALEMLVSDIRFVTDRMVQSGTDGIDMDTTGPAGDADFLAALTACRALRERYSWLGIEVGMAGEFVLGMHGQLEFDGERSPGCGPETSCGAGRRGLHLRPGDQHQHRQVDRLEHRQGNHLIKPAVEIAEIPIHVNVGMGVGGVPTCVYPPADETSRASKAFVEILRVDGL